MTGSPERPISPLHTQLDRRSFVRAAFAAPFFLSPSRAPFLSSTESCVREIIPNPELSDRMLVVDFSPQSCRPYLSHETIFPNEKLMGDMALDIIDPGNRALYEFLLQTADEADVLGHLREKILTMYPDLTPVAAKLDEVQGHGEIVGETVESVLRTRKIEAVPTIRALQEMYDDVEATEDELGNRVFSARLNTEKFINKLYEYPDVDLINFSWQVGEVGVKIVTRARDDQGNIRVLIPPRVEYLGAYRKETAYKHLTELAKVCKAHENKLFIVAAGNHGDDLREARAIMKAEGNWPENVLVVGEWFPKERMKDDTGEWIYKLNAFGADLYVETNDQKYNTRDERGSTVATAIIFANIAYLMSRGLSPKKAKQKILEEYCSTLDHLATSRSVQPGTAPEITTITSNVFEPGKVTN